MSPSAPLLRMLVLACATAFALVVVVDPYAHAGPNRVAPTAEARAAGITEAGDAVMGWRTKAAGVKTRAPDGQAGSDRAPAAVPPSVVSRGVLGIDVSGWQGTVNWPSWYAAGKRFAYVKATEGTYFRNRYFSSQYTGSYNAGFIRGAYHFANPSSSPGWQQADFFAFRGGAWSRDGQTLPGVLDIEFNPYGPTCYGLTDAQMVSWIRSFTARYKYRTGRDAVIYTNGNWWRDCTGNSTAFNRTNPLWVARYSNSVGTLPGGWPYYTFWQYSSTPIDQNHFNGSYARLKVLANGG